jgi:hypothetical protein
MYTTKYSIAEQVMLRLKNGRPDLANQLDMRDVIAMVPQVAAKSFQIGYFNTTLPSGETIPDGLMLATFTIPVTHGEKQSTATLPARPISLPRQMGVFAVYDPAEPFTAYIPALPGQMAMLDSQPLMKKWANFCVIYEVNGGKLVFKNKIIPNTLTCQMFIADIAGVSDTDPIPVTQDMELEIVGKLFEFFAQDLPQNKQNDLLTDNKTN